ncbi:MAG TPA: hypothetical protein VN719_00480 [Gemmatimonadales bacterium]|nr:hypothetical protein [Gemmatimonadales bacterium]HXS22679.1 hypothetical protein [Gemmatimonadales bacterium]
MRTTFPRLRVDDEDRPAPGPDLDVEIDRRIFRHEDPADPEPYSSAYEASLLLEYALSRSGWMMDVANKGPYWVKLERGGECVMASGDTVELALCRAALKAVDAASSSR